MHCAFIIIEFVPYVCIIYTLLFVGIIALKHRDIIGFMCFSYCGIVILSYKNITVGLCCINGQNSGGRSFDLVSTVFFAKGGNYSQQRDITDKIEQGRQLQTLLFLIRSMKKACIVAKWILFCSRFQNIIGHTINTLRSQESHFISVLRIPHIW